MFVSVMIAATAAVIGAGQTPVIAPVVVAPIQAPVPEQCGTQAELGIIVQGGKTPETGIIVQGGKTPETGIIVQGGKTPETGIIVQGGKTPQTGIIVQGGKTPETGIIVQGGKTAATGIIVQGGLETSSVDSSVKTPELGGAPQAKAIAGKCGKAKI